MFLQSVIVMVVYFICLYYSVWNLLSFLNPCVDVVIKFGKILAYIYIFSLLIFLSSPNGTLVMQMLNSFLLSYRSLRLCLFYYFLFFSPLVSGMSKFITS